MESLSLTWLHGVVFSALLAMVAWLTRMWMTRKDKKVDDLDSQYDDLKERLIRIEAKMPNGELSTIVYRMGEIDKKLVTVLEHVDEHNKEAEDWKRRIVALEGQSVRTG